MTTSVGRVTAPMTAQAPRVTAPMTVPQLSEMAPAPVTRLKMRIARRTILTVLLIVAGVWLLGQLTTVLEIMLVALILVGTFDPLVAWLEVKGCIGAARSCSSSSPPPSGSPHSFS